MRKIPALKIHQWLPEWDAVKTSASGMRRPPPHHFYMFSIAARDLKALSGVQRRSVEDRQLGSLETGIQRRLDRKRSSEIRDYMQFGFPYASFGPRDRNRFGNADSKMPGWLPTAIVVNIFNSAFPDRRKGQQVAEEDHIQIQDGNGPYASLLLPDGFECTGWQPEQLHPIEVIDGQHRLWAVEDSDELDTFELPVVAFHGLDLSWQAYLFYTINIRPVKINTSLAFDLYPLLRTENWLTHVEGPRIYRETRAQEIVQSLYSHPLSPWHHHINMLGERGQRMVRQAAWIRALQASYIKPISGQGITIGGLFGAIGAGQTLEWHGAQQVAFIIYLGKTLRDCISAKTTLDWAAEIRKAEGGLLAHNRDPAFHGRYSLLNTDQGIRGFLSVTNDLAVLGLQDLQLQEWVPDVFGSPDDEEAIAAAVESLSSHSKVVLLDQLMAELAAFDWRTSSAPGLKEYERTMKMSLRGSGGYREVKRHLLLHVAEGTSYASGYANAAIDRLGLGSN